MPELPEVETVRNILLPLVKNKTIDHVDVFYDKLVLSNLEEFKTKLVNQVILDINRYGKYLFFILSNDLILISHLRMEGKYRYNDNNLGRNKHISAIFYFKDQTSLAYDDTRKFGIMYLTNKKEVNELPMIKKLGIEANKIDNQNKISLYQKFNKNKKIKELLLDQSIICGIGNIYADEILFASKIHPLTKGKDLSKTQLDEIFKNTPLIINKAIQAGGSTIHSFHPSEGVDGRFQTQLLCYGNEGKECPNCKTKFHKIFIGGRGTTFCPNCQIDKTLEKAIGITGPIGSGKSTILNYLATKNYFIINCDQKIHELYRIPAIKNKISKILKTDFDIDNLTKKELARKIMANDATLKKEVENYIYPILEESLINENKNHDLIAIEAPLLFKAHIEYLFKKIIVVEISKEKQLNNLDSRNEANKNLALKLNNDYFYDLNSSKIYRLENNSTLKDLYKKIDKILEK